MFIINLIPLSPIPRPYPQILSYFYKDKLAPGCLALIAIRKRELPALVLSCQPLSQTKMYLRQADFQLKPLSKIITSSPIIPNWQLQFIKWLAQYYFAPLTLVAKRAMPAALVSKTSQGHLAMPALNRSISPLGPSYLYAPLPRRLSAYRHHIRSCLSKHKQALIIAPTLHHLEYLSENLKPQPVLWHSQLTAKNRWLAWQKIRTGKPQIILATKSGIFSPVFNLGLLILDDAINDSHKSWDQNPKYDARTCVQKIAQLIKAKLIIGSSLPLISAYKPTQAVFRAPMSARIEIVNQNQEFGQKNFLLLSRLLQQELAQNKQAILFLNRRGLARYLVCKNCGYQHLCPHCSSPLVLHANSLLFCHHCQTQQKMLGQCPQCQSALVKYQGAGTQKLLNQVQKIMPQAKIACLDKDASPSFKEQQQIITEFKNQKTRIIIGTQMLFNEAFDIKADLAAVINLDQVLMLANWQANEKLWQTIYRLKQMAEKQLIIQTFSPQSPALKNALTSNWPKFYQQEISARKTFFYPPFSQLIKLSFSHFSQTAAKKTMAMARQRLNWQIKALARQTPDIIKTQLSSIFPALVFRQKNKYIYHLLIKWPKKMNSRLRNQLLSVIPPNIALDIEPKDVV